MFSTVDRYIYYQNTINMIYNITIDCIENLYNINVFILNVKRIVNVIYIYTHLCIYTLIYIYYMNVILNINVSML